MTLLTPSAGGRGDECTGGVNERTLITLYVFLHVKHQHQWQAALKTGNHQLSL